MARLLFTALSAAGTLLVAAPAGNGQTYPAYSYEERDGLPSGVVYDIAQETSGRMWFATRAGLVSYDGQEWTLETPLGGTPLCRIEIGANDHIWASTSWLRSGLMSRPADGPWTHVPAPEEVDGSPVVEIRSISRGQRAGLLIGTLHQLYEVWAGDWREVPLPEEITQINDLEASGERVVLAAPEGLWVKSTTGWNRVRIDAPDTQVCALAPTGTNLDDPLWLVGLDWIGLLEGERFTLSHQGHEVFASQAALVREDSGATPAVADGLRGVWFGHRLGLSHFDLRSGELRDQGVSTGMVANGANSLYLDLDGNTWIATPRGITRVSTLRFSNYDRSSGLINDEVNAILEHPPGRIVLGQPGGLALLDQETGVITTIKLPLGQRDAERAPVLEMTVDRDDVLWMAVSGFGLARLTAEGEVIPLPASMGSYPQTVHCDQAGRLWTGSSAGLLRIEGNELVAPGNVPVQDGVRRITTLSDGSLAIATIRSGAWIETADGWSNLRGPSPEVARAVYAMHRDQDGRLLIGALDGLFWNDNGVLEPLPLGGEFIRDPVYSVNRDADGRFWFGTQLGVVSWNGTELRRYGVHQGLSGLETNRAANLLDSSGAMWFGTVKGASRYSATDDLRAERTPVIESLGVEVEGRLQPSFEDLTLSHDTNDPVFRFRAISFIDDGLVEYRARLEGFDDAWIPPGEIDMGMVRYTNVPTGSYHFVVQARSRGGHWGAEARTGALHIKPPFWLTGWFLTASLLTVCGVGIGLRQLTSERRNARELQVQVDQRTAELLRSQKLESLGLLAGGVAHDFNNLLTAVMAHCELGRLDAGDSLIQHLDSIDMAAERGASLTKALLGYARRQETSPQVLILNQGIVELKTMMRPLIRAEIDLRIELAPDLDATLLDPGQLEQIVMNLAVNASDAMPTGGVLTIKTDNVKLREPLAIAHDEVAPAGDWVRLAVSDTGVGMDEHTSARLFDPFFTTKDGGRGTGLGLSTCHGIVKQNGGFVDFATAPGQGTTFSIYLPATDAAEAPELRPAPASNTEELLGACVLLAEDDAMVRPMLAQALERAGCRVLLAASAEEGLRIAGDYPGTIDLLISDVIMPGMSGPELRERLAQERPEMLALFISGYTADILTDRESAPAQVELLHKPFSPDELLALAAHVLGSDRAEPEISFPGLARSESRSPARSSDSPPAHPARRP